MTIKHIVISGGGQTMIQSLGAVQHLDINNIINLNEIKSIYATSAGAIVAVLLSLKFDWETINDYIIKRPWHDVFPIKIQDIFNAFTSKGLFDHSVIEKCFKPLFDAKDIALDITLQQFYEYMPIEIHFFTFEINEFVTVDISYLTHPNLKLLTAIQMSCALPVLITPICMDNKCFIDGGVSCNYPLSYCIAKNNNNEEEIIGIINKYNDGMNNIVNHESTLLDFIMSFLFKLIHSLSSSHLQPKIKHEIICDATLMSISSLKSVLYSSEVRKELWESGIQSGKKYIEFLL